MCRLICHLAAIKANYEVYIFCPSQRHSQLVLYQSVPSSVLLNPVGPAPGPSWAILLHLIRLIWPNGTWSRAPRGRVELDFFLPPRPPGIILARGTHNSFSLLLLCRSTRKNLRYNINKCINKVRGLTAGMVDGRGGKRTAPGFSRPGKNIQMKSRDKPLQICEERQKKKKKPKV